MNITAQGQQYTPDELSRVMEHLSGLFTEARLVDPVACKELALSPEGDIEEAGSCYDRWHICDRCENCISQKALEQGCKHEKFELMGDEMYWLLSKPIGVVQSNGKRFGCVIEVMNRSTVGDYGALLESNPDVAQSLLSQKGFFLDWSSKMYNRRYFDEGVYLSYLNRKSEIDLGVIVCKLENSEFLVDVFGSKEREAAVWKLAQLLERRCRVRDLIVRVDDDKFLVLLPSAGIQAVRDKVAAIRRDAPEVVSDSKWGSVDVSVSVGFAWAPSFDRTSAHVNALFREAEENAYLDRRGIRKSWDDSDGSWKFSVSDAVKAAGGSEGVGASGAVGVSGVAGATGEGVAGVPGEGVAGVPGAADAALHGGVSLYDGVDGTRMEDASTIAAILESAPETAADPLSVWFREFAKKDRGRPSDTFKFPLPLMGMPFEPGTMRSVAEKLGDETERLLAQIERHYLTGEYLAASRMAETLVEGGTDLSSRAAAGLLESLANMATNHPAFARRARDRTVALCQRGMLNSSDSNTRAVCAIVDSTIIMFFGEQRVSSDPITQALAELPEGQRLYASFLAAHAKFKAGEFGNALGIVSTAMSYSTDVYPIPMIYLHIVAASSHMALRQIPEAIQEFNKGWALAQADGIFSPFVEHYVKLQGLFDACLKDSDPDAYRTISKAARMFRAGWVCLVDPSENSDYVATLSASEMTIVGLASRGWTNREIAVHVKLSENTV